MMMTSGMAHKVISAAGSLLLRIGLQATMEEFGDMSVSSLSRDELDHLLEKYGGNEEAMVVEYDEDIYEHWNKETLLPSKEELEEILKEYEYIGEVDQSEVDMEEILMEFDSEPVDEYCEVVNNVSDDVNNNRKKRVRKRTTRRGGRSKKKFRGNVDINILQTNCDGYISKKESIEDIVNDRETDVLLLNDTALKGKRKVKMKDYFSFCKNRIKAKGGVAAVIANYLRPHTVKTISKLGKISTRYR